MPIDAMLVSAGVTIAFLLFAGVLPRGDYQTRPDPVKAGTDPQKRRSF